MASINDYISSLQKNKPTYSSLSGLKGTSPTLPSFNLFGSSKPATPAPQVQPAAPAAAAPTSPTPSPTTTAKTQPAAGGSRIEKTASGGTIEHIGGGKVYSNPMDNPAYRDYLSQFSPAVKSSGDTAAAEAKAAGKSGSSSGSTKSTDPYLSYLESLFDPAALKSARANMEALNERTANEILRARKREDELRENKIGQLKIGQDHLLGENERLSNKSLADLAIAKGANMDVYNQMIGAGKSVYEAKQAQQKYDDERADKTKKEGFSLSEGQARYEIDPETGQYVKVASVGKTYAPGTGSGSTYVAGDNPTVDSWAQRIFKGQAKITDIPASQAGLRNSVMNALAAMGDAPDGMSSYQSERAARTIQSVDELMKKADASPGIFGRSAIAPIPGFLRSDDFRNFAAELDTLKASIAFGELTAMREASKTGGALGQVSNIELALLESALGALRMDQSPENFKQQLQKIKDSIGRWQAAATGMGAAGGSSELPPQMQLPDGTILNLQADGTYE